jgi:hypothetical protein
VRWTPLLEVPLIIGLLSCALNPRPIWTRVLVAAVYGRVFGATDAVYASVVSYSLAVECI